MAKPPLWKQFLRLMRPAHYMKNILILIPIVCDRNLFHVPELLSVALGFCAFSLLSSAVYIFNDIRDAEADRRHEIKKRRPIASGAVSVPAAAILAAVLLFLSASLNVLSIALGGVGNMLYSYGIMLLYLLVNFAYSMGLKEVPIFDVTLLVSGFLLRVLYGAEIISSYMSPWVFLTVMSLSFYMGFGKRRNELKKTRGGETRRVLAFYSRSFLDKFMYLCLGLAVTFYALWSSDKGIVERYGTEHLIWTVPLVLIVLMKYSADIETDDSYGDPVDVILHDKILLAMAAGFALVFFLLVYLPVFQA